MSKRISSRAHTKPSSAKRPVVASAASPQPSTGPTAWQSFWQRSGKVTWLIPLALALLFSLPVLANDFTVDDRQQLANNPFLKSWENLPLAFTSHYRSLVNVDLSSTSTPEYRPLGFVWLVLNHMLFGLSPAGWHVSNLLLHLAATVFVFLVCNRFTGQKNLALMTACLFAVHAAHAEAVAWVFGFADPLLALFLLPAFSFYLRFRERGQRQWLVLMSLFFLLSLWTKTTAFALLPIIAYCEVFHFREGKPAIPQSKRLLLLCGALLLPIAIYSLMRYQAMGSPVSTVNPLVPVPMILATMPLVTLKYLKLVALPFGYSPQHYTPWVTSFADLRFLAPLAGLVLLAVLILMSRSRQLKFASLWLLLFLVPAIVGISTFEQENLVQEKSLYLPSLGFCLATALGINWLLARLPAATRGLATAALVGALVLLMGVAYIRQSRAWHDQVTIFERAVDVEPDSPYALSSLGGAYFGAGKPREAEDAVRRALEMDPQHIKSYQFLSYFNKQFGKLDLAIEQLEWAKSQIPVTPLTRRELATVSLNLGLLYGQKKMTDRAEENLKQSLALWDRPLGWYQVGLYYFGQERFAEALPYYEKAVALAPPNYAPIHLSIAVVYDRLEQKEKAIASYNTYLRMAPPTAADREKVWQALQTLENPGRGK